MPSGVVPARPPLRLALPKGRLLSEIEPLLARAGVPTAALGSSGRRLVIDDPSGRVCTFLLKPDDVPTYVEGGTCDAGIVGRDVLLERGYDLYCPVDLRVGRCRIVLAGPPGRPRPSPLRVATKYVAIAQRYFASRGTPAHFVPLSGSIEIAPRGGLADLVVDIVQTGETLRQNRLEVIDTICEVSAVLVVNRTALKLRKDLIAPLIARLRAAAA